MDFYWQYGGSIIHVASGTVTPSGTALVVSRTEVAETAIVIDPGFHPHDEHPPDTFCL